jgi:hypothetical protein
VVLLALVGLLVSCATPGPYKPLSEIKNAEVLGTIQTEFVADGDYIGQRNAVNEQAYIRLLYHLLRTFRRGLTFNREMHEKKNDRIEPLCSWVNKPKRGRFP